MVNLLDMEALFGRFDLCQKRIHHGQRSKALAVLLRAAAMVKFDMAKFLENQCST